MLQVGRRWAHVLTLAATWLSPHVQVLNINIHVLPLSSTSFILGLSDIVMRVNQTFIVGTKEPWLADSDRLKDGHLINEQGCSRHDSVSYHGLL